MGAGDYTVCGTGEDEEEVVIALLKMVGFEIKRRRLSASYIEGLEDRRACVIRIA